MKKVLLISRSLILMFCLLLVVPMIMTANNVSVSNVFLTGQNTTDDYTLVEFDLSQENSWRISTGASNWDAVWVFVKYKTSGGDWQHCYLNNSGNSTGSGTAATVQVGLLDEGSSFHITTNPALGAFIYRSGVGSGAFSITDAQLRWNYGANGVADGATVNIKVSVIEMVYVPEGSFYVGSGGEETSEFYAAPNTTSPYQITGEGAITVAATGDKLYYPSTSYGGDQSGPIPAAFPKGYAGFYSMKYEVSQQQYIDFLNTLTATQAGNRFPNKNTYRHAITVSEGVYSTTNPYVACNWLTFMDGAAYADWAGLRPMTELEYEKACRGSQSVVANEYAWGTSTNASSAYTLSNAGASNESIATNYSTSAGNVSYIFTDGNIDGPLRVGIFATSSSSRVDAGASYWGIMELSGNLRERTVTVGNSTGRSFTGQHGNGALSTAGHADVSNWPGLVSGEVTGGTGAGFRGGDWSASVTHLQVSKRYFGAYGGTERQYYMGARAFRGLPTSTGE